MTSGVTLVITSVGAPRRRLLARALESVWRQTLQPDTIVIAQDNDRRGAAHNRQQGTDSVTTEWVAYLDDDDQLYTNHLERLMARAAEPDLPDLVYPWFDVVGGTDPFPHHEGLPFRNEEPVQIPVTFLARTSAIRTAGGWVDPLWDRMADNPGTDPEGNRAGEDWRLTLRLIEAGAKIVHLPERTWVWHHGQNTSGLPSRVDWNRTDW